MAYGRDDVDRYRARVRGCLLGGAVGDALGAPVEFMTADQITAMVGEAGVREYLDIRWDGISGTGLVTDDTQMTLFTVEGIIRARVREDRGLGFTVAVLDHAYRRWLDTQLHDAPTGERDGWLQGEAWLYSRRAPGTTCLGALQQAVPGRFGGHAANSSKGCGSVMRSAPFGLMRSPFVTSAALFDLAHEAAAYTHGHPTARVASGALAFLVHELVEGSDLAAGLDATIEHVSAYEPGGETVRALEHARRAADERDPSASVVEGLGQGWVAEEALAIAVYCALVHPAPDQVLDALCLAVTHSGDSDSTGAICGNILGALHGDSALPAALVFEVEGRGTILQLADDFVLEGTATDQLHGEYGPITRWLQRYPGW